MTQDDGLALPIDFGARYGAGHDRTLVLGGGGIFFVTWQTAYLHGMMKRGVRLEDAQIVVGTSAGSILASVLTKGRLGAFSRTVDVLAKLPRLVSALAPSGELSSSQARALDTFRRADNASPEIVREVGRAAMAARTQPPPKVRRNLFFSVGPGWPSDRLRITAVDAYTAERVVLTSRANITAAHAVAASSAVPGIFPPQPLGDRFLMDGGTAGSGTHCDVVAGAERALVISLTANATQEIPMMTIAAGARGRELEDLAGSGTAVQVRGPHEFDIDKLMDPTASPRARALGELQAEQDAGELREFWR